MGIAQECYKIYIYVGVCVCVYYLAEVIEVSGGKNIQYTAVCNIFALKFSKGDFQIKIGFNQCYWFWICHSFMFNMV